MGLFRRAAGTAVVCGVCSSLAGCHSRYIEATITNHTAAPLSVVQVDYPSASFGTQGLQPGQSFHYRFKLLGTGTLKISYVDAKHGEHQQTGPVLTEGDEGRLQIDFTAPDHADFQTSLHRQ